MHVIACDIRYVGKETDSKWREGQDPSVLEFAATEYGRTGKVVASEDVRNNIGQSGSTSVLVKSGFDRKNFIRKLIRGIPVKRNSYSEFLRWLRAYNSDAEQNVAETAEVDERYPIYR